MTVLVVSEHDNGALKGAVFNCITAAAEIGEVTVLVAGADCRAAADEAASVAGVARVLLAEDEAYKNPVAENFAPLVMSLVADYSHILAPATTFGKNLMPRVAALADVQQISEITAVIDADTFERPFYAGNASATGKSSDPSKVITVRATGFDAAGAGGEAATIEDITGTGASDLSEFISTELSVSERPELTQAGVIISGGRGMQSGDNFVLLEAVADKLGAAVGASRAAVDSGFVPNDYQVGQTGKIVAPDLYIAVGISGAIQHLAGMKDSKVIVAINKDEEAPIFQVADYGLVADLFSALPELAEKLDE